MPSFTPCTWFDFFFLIINYKLWTMEQKKKFNWFWRNTEPVVVRTVAGNFNVATTSRRSQMLVLYSWLLKVKRQGSQSRRVRVFLWLCKWSDVNVASAYWRCSGFLLFRSALSSPSDFLSGENEVEVLVGAKDETKVDNIVYLGKCNVIHCRVR